MRLYAGSVAALVMPLAAKAIKQRAVDYQYDPQKGLATFRGSKGMRAYCPEECHVYPMGGGSAILQAQRPDDDHAREWSILGVPGLDSYGWGDVLDAGQSLGAIDDDLQMSLYMQPLGGGEGVAANPLSVLKQAHAGFVDVPMHSGAALQPTAPPPEPSTAIQPAAAQPPAAPDAQEILKWKPQYTSTDLLIVGGATAAITALIVYGFSRR
jgi:hypothetical protein